MDTNRQTAEENTADMEMAASDSRQKGKKAKKGKNPFQYKVSLQVVKKEGKDVLQESEQGEGEEQAAVAPPPKKKKTKPKKVKKAKPPKTKKTKDGKSKKPLIIILIVLLLAIIGVVMGILIYRSGNSIEAKLAKAANFLESGEYSSSIELYNEVIFEDNEIPDAYLGIAEAYVGLDEVDSAVALLRSGYQYTEDERIAQRLGELAPIAEEEEAQLLQDTVVEWQDSAFAEMVRMALGKGASDPILRSELESVRTLKIVGGTHVSFNDTVATINTMDGYTIDDMLYTDRGSIRSIADAANFPNLTKLIVSYNSVESLRGIESLSKLETLGVYCNNISDLTPLSGLSNLKYLYAYDNQVTSLAPLSGLNLTQLLVQHNQISDLSPVSGMVNLMELFVGDNNISDISPLINLNNLRYLYAQNNSISDIGTVAGMDSLTDVSFVGNPVSDYSPSSGVKNVNKSFGTAR